jgi:hypothetical protein
LVIREPKQFDLELEPLAIWFLDRRAIWNNMF